MAPPHQHHLRVLRTSLVAPPPPPPPLRRECSIPLTYLDTMWLSAPPVERLFFYRLVAPHDADSIFSNLTRSLSHALQAFYPLAGRLRLRPGSSNRYELYYNPREQGEEPRHGVTFTVAEYDAADIDNLATDDPRELAKLAPLVPPLPEGGAVLALQATLLSARRGLALGVTVHHAACDGAASTQFLHTWAAAACGGAGEEQGPPPPFIDRTIIRDRKDFHDMFTAPRPNPSPSNDDRRKAGAGGGFFKESPDADQLLATFTLSKGQLQSAKDAVAREAARRGVAPPRCTSTVASFGLVWQCHCRAKEAGDEPSASGSSRSPARTYLYFPIDQRPRLDPHVPAEYLGNCVGPCFASAPRKEVATAGAEGLFTACAAVAGGISEAVRGGPGYWNASWWMERIMEAFSVEQPLSVAGSPRFQVYDVDLGFGRPAKVDIVSVARTGAVAVAESRGGAGGMEVGVSLPADAMDRFGSCFADAIIAIAS